MENEDIILNNSQDPEECKINDSNKNLDKDLCLFLPKNIVEEISEKKTENSEIMDQSQFSFSAKKNQNSNKHNHIEISNNMKNHMKNHMKNGNFIKNNFNNNHNSECNIKINNDFNNLQKLNFITKLNLGFFGVIAREGGFF